ncbi:MULTISPECIES: TerB family tellurite resistance protein [Burkholderia]|uniref:TerB family tellurite resistance protein n=1 Tax=Burkholderia TaxID=32008 RepID=UPI00158D4A47|nr:MULTISPECIES: TerB family tellurite resistance protein [Burkholderia]
MRTRPRDSAQTAVRIVALVLIADGHIDPSDERLLEELEINCRLGIESTEFAQIIQTVCENREVGHVSSSTMSGHLNQATLETLLAEIHDPDLRVRIIEMCLAVASADGHLADGEISVLAIILTAWTPQTLNFALEERSFA